ncbi:MAG TPA: hypothetical protein VL461_07585 [Dictyobacter sp.]|jgi:hypothetical protein|nr:hypothetical protein [Dictyobacter sp.]
MIDTFMAVWNRLRRRNGITFFLVCLFLSMGIFLFATVGLSAFSQRSTVAGAVDKNGGARPSHQPSVQPDATSSGTQTISTTRTVSTPMTTATAVISPKWPIAPDTATTTSSSSSSPITPDPSATVTFPFPPVITAWPGSNSGGDEPTNSYPDATPTSSEVLPSPTPTTTVVAEPTEVATPTALPSATDNQMSPTSYDGGRPRQHELARAVDSLKDTLHLLQTLSQAILTYLYEFIMNYILHGGIHVQRLLFLLASCYV